MEIVINIPDEVWDKAKEYGHLDICGIELSERVMNGTPLPKGHGRLIDADALEKRMLDREEELGDDQAMWESSAVSVALDMFAPTIIESNKIESEYKE